MRRLIFHYSILFAAACMCCLFTNCKKPGTAQSAFYYWKSTFTLNETQHSLLQNTAQNVVYLKFFDVRWNDQNHMAYPDASINFVQQPAGLTVNPVIFITNKTFEQIQLNAVDSLAIECNGQINHIAQKNKISYQLVQIDCDWTLETRDKYFAFLKAFKQLNKAQLEATIRLHQVKYKQRTGVPPVDRGVLMFYNMGKVNADLAQPNSIYNEADAAKYVDWVKQYPLPLDVALPLFSWAVHIREGKVMGLYSNLKRNRFDDAANFEKIDNGFRAKKSFFLNGFYVQENDIFKLEEIDATALEKAAKQLSPNLALQQNRTIIYYELGNLDSSEFTAETLNQVSAAF